MQIWKRRRPLGIGLIGAAVLAVVAVVCVAALSKHPRADGAEVAGAGGDAYDGDSVEVKTVQPKRDPTFEVTAQRPAEVRAYQKEDLFSQVAGRIKAIHVDIGTEVKEGQVLIDIDVPDLVRDLEAKKAAIDQRRQDLAVAQANVAVATAAWNAAQKNVDVKTWAAEEAKATEIFRNKRLRRLRLLLADNGTTQEVVDEEEEYLIAAQGGVRKAQADILKAQEDVKTAAAKLKAANADVELKRALIEVARKDRDKAQVLVDFARITAPFQSEVKERPYDVNPGAFVQNATTAGHPEPLLTLERTDIVTISMQLPDIDAPYIDKDTDAIIEMGELRGQQIHAKVTRYDRSLETSAHDKTMRVEVDVYNDSWERYQKWLAEEKAKGKKPGDLHRPFDDLKDEHRPVFPTVTGPNAGIQPPRLLPGYYGEMTLVLRKGFENYYFVPSDAVIRSGGTPYVILAENGEAHQVPVKVVVDNGKVANIRLLVKGPSGQHERELSPEDHLVYSNQAELTEGQAVRTVPWNWQP
jgi:multidrug efflux pump subunit AcrA (membrane-fusion protein)